jgi:NhaA family Na+:H+ antiporter
MLGGIGFTVALLISDLAFQDEGLIDEAKLGVLAGSVVSGFAGLVFLWLTTNGRGEPSRQADGLT